MNFDKAGQQYWNNSWTTNHSLPQAVNPKQRGVNNYTNQCFHKYFSKIFSGIETKNLKLLEIGCARSKWLPYFAKEFGFQVYGLDYSENGCQQAREILAKEGVHGEIICANMFSPPENMLEQFDVIVSFGVIEHFEDTTGCIYQVSKLLKKGGLIITIIPNMTGLIGFFQKKLNKQVYDIHVCLDSKQLSSAHTNAGLKVLECQYFMAQSLGLIGLNNLENKTLSDKLKLFTKNNLTRLGKMIWLFETYLWELPESSLFSPYVICYASKELEDGKK